MIVENTGTFRLEVDFEGRHYTGVVLPSEDKDAKGFPVFFRVEIDGELYAYICCGEAGWNNRDNNKTDDGLISVIGQYIHDWYE